MSLSSTAYLCQAPRCPARYRSLTVGNNEQAAAGRRVCRFALASFVCKAKPGKRRQSCSPTGNLGAQSWAMFAGDWKCITSLASGRLCGLARKIFAESWQTVRCTLGLARSCTAPPDKSGDKSDLPLVAQAVPGGILFRLGRALAAHHQVPLWPMRRTACPLLTRGGAAR
jgi:hypothetical protein